MSDSSHSDGAHKVQREKDHSTAKAEPKEVGQSYVVQDADAMAVLDLQNLTESPHHPIYWPLWQRWALTVVYW